MAEVTLFYERPDKIWAMMPNRPGMETFEDVAHYLRQEQAQFETTLGATPDDTDFAVHVDNLSHYLRLCTIGLAHLPDLAERRMHRAAEAPRPSSERLYERSLVEAGYHAGALAVVAYGPANDNQPREWLVESFLGDSLEPRVHQLDMSYPSTFGIDVADEAELNAMIDQWYPQAATE